MSPLRKREVLNLWRFDLHKSNFCEITLPASHYGGGSKAEPVKHGTTAQVRFQARVFEQLKARGWCNKQIAQCWRVSASRVYQIIGAKK